MDVSLGNMPLTRKFFLEARFVLTKVKVYTSQGGSRQYWVETIGCISCTKETVLQNVL